MRRPVVPLDPSVERLLRIGSLVWAVAAIVGIELADGVGLIDHRPGFVAYEITARPAFLIAFAVGAATAWRWLLLGGAIASTTAAAMVAWYLRQLEPISATVVLVAFATPGLAWLLLDLHDRIRRRAMLGVALAALGVASGFSIGTTTWNDLFGPTHPASTAKPVASSRVEWIWTGAVTSRSATVVADPVGSDDVDLIVSTVDGRTVRRIPVARSGRVVRGVVNGLEPDTGYSIRVVRRDEITSAGVDEARFRTFPDGDADITIAFGSCMRTGSNGAVFDAITALGPDLFVQAGDLHYGNIDDDDPDEFRDVLDLVLSRPGVSQLLRATPIAYVWDDHDYGGNNAAADSRSRPAAMQVYREYVPHAPLAGVDSPIHQAVDVGPVRVLLTDVRSAREPGRTMLGDDQLDWLEGQLLDAHASSALTIWVSPVGWIGDATPGDDAWAGQADERRQIADFIARHGIDRLVLVSGDAHMVAIDDGTNSDYSTTGGPGFPVLNAAALDRPGAVKGGPYSEGTFPGGGQFGVIEVSTDDGRVHVRLSGRDWSGRTLVSYEREFARTDDAGRRPSAPAQLTRRPIPSQ